MKTAIAPAFDEADIDNAFTERVISTGHGLYENGLVRLAPMSDFCMSAYVGGAGRDHFVGPIFYQDAFGLRAIPCSCSSKGNCKHVVAALYAVLNVQSAPTKASTSTTTSTSMLIYLLRSVQAGSLVDVEPFLAKVKARDGYVPVRSLDWRDVARKNLPFILPEDRDLARMLAPNKFDWDEACVDPVLIRGLMEALVNTGRLFYLSVDNPPLKMGDAREAKLEWVCDRQGNQHLAAKVIGQKAELLQLAHAWYIDDSNWTCGPTNLEISDRLMDLIWRAPVVRPEEAPLMVRRIQSLSMRDAPLPRTDIDVEVTTGKLTPVLRLGHEPGRDIGTNSPHSFVAYLSYRYGADPVTSLSAAEETRDFDGKRVKIARRDLPREKDCIRLLYEVGLEQRLSNSAGVGQIVFGLRGASVAMWIDFIQNRIPNLTCDGWEVLIDVDFPFNVLMLDQSPWHVEFGPKSDWWFEINLGIDVDGERVPLLPIIKRALNDPELIKQSKESGGKRFFVQLPDGRKASIAYERVQAIIDVLMAIFQKDEIDADGAAVISLGDVFALQRHGGDWLTRWLETADSLQKFRAFMKGFAGIPNVTAPLGLRGKLREYQLEGLSWLQFLSEHQLSGILADDMGLGKTIQAIAHLLCDKERGLATGPSLIVCPTSVVPNWMSELARFAPELDVVCYHGSRRGNEIEAIPHADVVVTSYDIATRDGAGLRRQHWHALILDEAQRIKNDDTVLGEMIRSYTSHHRICMTGTPIENNLGELWSQFDFLMPGYLGTKKFFNSQFRNPIEKKGNLERQNELIARVRPFILRRTKDKVATQLPPKTEIIREITLTGDQRDLYETVRLSMHQRVRKQIEANGLARSKIIVLTALLRLRQVCCDPRLLKMDAARDVRGSAKLDDLMQLLPALLDGGSRILLFSQFTSMLDLIGVELQSRGMQFVQIRGDTRDRITPVNRFQSGEVPLFLLSLKAAGIGLNLTAADTVIHYDPWWNPAALDQANDRAHRIGQDKPVFVYHLITAGTIEAKMTELQRRKKALANVIYKGAQAGIEELTEADIDALFGE